MRIERQHSEVEHTEEEKKLAQERKPLRGLVAGAIGGAAAAYIMEKVQVGVMPKIQDAFAKSDDGGGEKESGDEGEPATVQAAEAVAENLFDKEISEERKPQAGEAAHYAMGIVSGALYGVAAEYEPRVTRGYGTLFGTGVWAIADEMVVPALGLGEPPQEAAASTHAYALASHLVYGAATEAVRRSVRRIV